MKRPIIASALALAALTGAEAAQAQQQACVTAADLGDTMVYAMPIAYDAVSTTCAGRFAKNGFMLREGEGFIAGFRARQDAAWPGAFRLFKTFMARENAKDGSDDDEIATMIAALPEESLRPFIDGIVGQMIAKEIKPDSCGKIERGVELLSPLPVDNIAGLATFIAELADVKNPEICTTDAVKRTK
ncbi:MAG: hypothetical protein GC147_00610 [Porphyrobacter sp.]|nr:hypothetical protein [Porphyrobacter sp.]